MNRTSSSFSHIVMRLVLVLALLAVARPAGAWNNGDLASLVLGQPNFTSNASASSQSGISMSQNVAVDPATGAIFVADMNNRVLRFASLAALSNGANAAAVLGQPNFTSNTATATQTGMNDPVAMVVDNAGRLWVADMMNNRVLRFDNAVSKANGANADGVLGQPDFTSSAAAVTQAGMYWPNGLALDSAGRLWVSDYYNNRVLRFDNAASKANGASADGVLGQPNFTSSAAAVTQAGMSNPGGVALDSAGRLWVTDSSSNRVLRFDNAASKANGANADGVLGQPNFTSNAAATTQAGMHSPLAAAIDNAGRLWVGELNNNRAVRFDNAAGKANGANADGVLGQPNFTSSATATTQAGMNGPIGMAVDSAGRLWVADQNNNRVLLYQEGVMVQQIARGGASPTNAASLTFVVTFDGPVNGLTASNFSLTSGGTLSGASITGLISTSASVYNVTVNTGTGSGTLRLDLMNATNLVPVVLTTLPYTGGEVYTIDRTAPVAPVISTPVEGSFINTARPSIGGEAGAAEAGATVTVRESSATLCAATASADGSWNCTPSADLAEGAHALNVTQADLVGNVSPASTRAFTIDTVGPDAPLISTPVEGSSIITARPSIGGDAGAAEAGAIVTVKEGDSTLCTATASADGSWNCTPSADLAEGAHTLNVTQADLAGNVSPASTRAFTIDTVGPDAPLISYPAEGSAVYSLRPAIGGSAGAAEADATVTVKEGDVTLCTATATADGSWSCTPAADLALGDHSLSVTQADPAGRISPTSTRSFRILTQLFMPIINK